MPKADNEVHTQGREGQDGGRRVTVGLEGVRGE